MTKLSFTKEKSVFIIDLILLPIFILVVYTGLKLHIAGHDDNYNHNIWEYWTHLHIIVSIVSLFLGWCHVKAHWGWYKGLIKKGVRHKSKITLSLSILFLILTITGVILILFVGGANSAIGLWHYRLGLAMILFLLIHFISRFSMLIKGLKRLGNK